MFGQEQIIGGKYRIDERIGDGAMGIVYQSFDIRLKRACAVKQLYPMYENSRRIKERFIGEAQKMAGLNHPNIVTVYDSGSDEDFGSYFVMELIRGRDLGRILREGRPFPVGDVARIGAAVASALEAAHRHGIVHRDIKPKNILIEDHTARAVVTDFGIAKNIEEEGDNTLTQENDFVGTFRYAAPEQIRNDRIDARADIYSLGTVLCEMLTGKRFLDGVKDLEIAGHFSCDDDWKPLPDFPASVPASLRALVERCLEKDRNTRFATAAEIRTVLEELQQHAAKVRASRRESENRILRYRQLEEEHRLSRIGLGESGGRSSEHFELVASKIGRLEDLGELAGAEAALERLRMEISAATQALEGELRDHFQVKLEEAGERRAEIVERCGGFVEASAIAAQEGKERKLADVLQRSEWKEWRERLSDVFSGLRELEDLAREKARAELGEIAQEIQSIKHQMEVPEGRNEEDDEPRPATELQAEIAVLLEEERYAEARRRADEILATALKELDEKRCELDRVRRDTDDALDGSERELARGLAREELLRGDVARESARREEELGRYGAALELYSKAGGAYRCVQSVLAAAIAERDSVREEPHTSLPPPPRSGSKGKGSRSVLAIGATTVVALFGVWLFAPTQTTEVPEPDPHVLEPTPPGARTTGLAAAAVSFFPRADIVTVREGTEQRFAVSFDETSNEAARTEWRFNGAAVARGVPEWIFEPDYAAAGAAPARVEVLVGDEPREPRHSWEVRVVDVNRDPIVGDCEPDSGLDLTAELGSTLAFRIGATDADGDPVEFTWTVDGEPSGDGQPTLNLAVTGDHSVSVSVSDGKGEASASWNVAAVAPSPLVLVHHPSGLERLPFNAVQEFSLTVPKPDPDHSIEYVWTLDGRRVHSESTYRFRANDPRLIRSKPVVVAATASTQWGDSVSHSWSFVVIPPPPTVERSSPDPSNGLTVEVSRALDLQVTPASPIGEQRFAFVFEVDGQEAARSDSSSFHFTTSREGQHRVAGFIEDNYRQKSDRVVWNVDAYDIVRRVQEWLKEYELAWGSGDVGHIGELRGLRPGSIERLSAAFEMKSQLRVAFERIEVRSLPGDRASADYRVIEKWEDNMGPHEEAFQVSHLLRWDGRRVEEEKLSSKRLRD